MYDSTESFFEKTGSREAFKSDMFRGLMLQIASITSYRSGIDLLNRIRRTDSSLIEMTFRNNVEREGLAIQRYMEEKATEAIEEEGLWL